MQKLLLKDITSKKPINLLEMNLKYFNEDFNIQIIR